MTIPTMRILRKLAKLFFEGLYFLGRAITRLTASVKSFRLTGRSSSSLVGFGFGLGFVIMGLLTIVDYF